MPKLKVKPTPAQSRALLYLLERDNYKIFNGKNRFFDSVKGDYITIRASTVRKMINEEWLEQDEEHSYFYHLSESGLEIAEQLKPDDLISPPKLITSETVIAALRDVHPSDIWLTVEEIGIRPWGTRRVDLFGLRISNIFRPGCQRGRSFEVRIFEVKVDRADFKKEVAHPPKYEAGMSLANRFYYAAPEGMIKIDELPKGAGLFEITKDGAKLTRQAKWSECEDPTWRLIAAIARRLNNVNV